MNLKIGDEVVNKNNKEKRFKIKTINTLPSGEVLITAKSGNYSWEGDLTDFKQDFKEFSFNPFINYCTID